MSVPQPRGAGRRHPKEKQMVFSYRDMMVTPAAVRQGDAFAATARIQHLNGMERSVRLPGEFPNVEEAIRYAIAAGFEYIDFEQRC
jgi:sugar/nucleoside kinase (ribokinase family)